MANTPDNQLRPRRVIALFPFAVAGKPPSPRQADLCRGFACLIEQILGELPGVLPILRHFFIVPESEPERKGWLVSDRLWTLPEIINFPQINEDNPTHVLQGRAHWDSEMLEVELEVIDCAAAEVVFREEISGVQGQSLAQFFEAFGKATAIMTGSVAAGRLVSTVPATSPAAFREYLVALAELQAFHHGLSTVRRGFTHLIRALREDHEFRLACRTFEKWFFRCQHLGGTPARIAQRALVKVEASGTAYPTFRAMLGFQLLHEGEETRARALLEDYLDLDPNGPLASEALEALARLYLDRREHEKAGPLLQSAVRINPENASAWEDLGYFHHAHGDRARAEECWRKALQQDPDRPRALRGLAAAYYQRGDAQSARVLLERLNSLDELDASATIAYLKLLLASEEISAADLLATAWVEEEAENPEAWYWIGLVRLLAGERDAAEFSLRKMGDRVTTPGHREYQQLLSKILVSKDLHKEFQPLAGEAECLLAGRNAAIPERLLERLKQLADKYEDLSIVWRILMALYELRGDFPAAAGAQERITAAHPEVAAEWHHLGVLRARAGDHANSASAHRRATILEPENEDHWLELGQALLRADQLREALQAFEAAIERAPGLRPELDKRLMRIRSRLVAEEEEQSRRASEATPRTACASPGLLRRILAFLRRG